MSRSIHATVHQWAELGRWHFTDEQEQAARRQEVLEQLLRKRRIGRQVIRQRRAESTARWPTPPGTIPIHLEQAGPYVHFPAGPADLRGVMSRLPAGVLDGLERIGLHLGSEDQLDRPGMPRSPRDGWSYHRRTTGRTCGSHHWRDDGRARPTGTRRLRPPASRCRRSAMCPCRGSAAQLSSHRWVISTVGRKYGPTA